MSSVIKTNENEVLYIRDRPFEFLGGGAGLFLVRPSFFFLLPENQDIFPTG